MEKDHLGLKNEEVAENRRKWGPNEIKDPDEVSAVKIVLRQLKNNFIIYLLLVAAVISFFVGESITGYTILGVIIMVIGVSFFQEYRAEKAIASLREMITPVSTVIRYGREQEVATADLVPGDVVVLRTGEKVPADCLVLREHDLQLNESLLTGESSSVAKNLEDTIFAGTFVINGKCLAKVTQTGMNTKFGQIVKMISRSEKELPLMEKINHIAKLMVVAAISISVLTGLLIVFQAESLNSQTLMRALIVTIALIVSAFPEGLPVVLTTCLAVGVNRMAKSNAIVNRMSIIETLGETTVICADKTGTITTGEMTVEKVYLDGNKNLALMHKAAALCNDARIERGVDGKSFQVFGSPTEGALLVKAAHEGIFREDLNFNLLEEIPFSSERKMMAVLGEMDGEKYVFAKGAPETILAHCKISETEKKRILKENETLMGGAYRTLAVAYKTQPASTKAISENSLVFLGLLGMSDPPREEIIEAVKSCKTAGIRVIMITGDHRNTAMAVASQIGLKGRVLSGDELDQMTDEGLKNTINNYNIFVRVRPEHKLRLVKILKSLGEVVTMTGDGVNDAPALKEAQIGVAMGRGGTDVSRSVADLTLKDNNFATVVLAVREGRTIFNNMRKFVSYQLSCNYAELMILFFGVLLAPILGWETPVLLALQILFMNLVTDDLPAITFAFNYSSKDVMEEPPRKKPEVVTGQLFLLSLLAGGLMTALTLFSFYLAYNRLGQDMGTARTTALIALILLEIVNAFNFRSFRFQTLTRSPLVNGYLFGASVLSILITLLVIYGPVQGVFGVVGVGIIGWMIPIGLSLGFILLFDILKLLNARWRLINFA